MKKRKSVIVELTSLLDVIFIMLFMVMNRSQTAAVEAQNEAAEEVLRIQNEAEEVKKEYHQKLDDYEKILSEVEEERENLEYMQNRIDSYQRFDEYARIVSVYIFDMGYKRSIKVTDGAATETIDFNWENIDYGKESLIDFLNEYVSDSETPVFIVFSYNSDTVYRRDYNFVSEAITEVQKNYNNVYIKFSDTAEG